ncbi:MAG: BON domain-containing protein [Planctomycetaceae bacterium]|jgi:osmotically-inducible protein OsmY|nr:BON domain-containing protein [Planctomycetaceae bacterium]
MDTLLKGKVNSALKKNPYLTGSNLHFEAEEGRVVLRGVVPSFFQKQMAQESLRSVEGIQEILNELEVMGKSLRLDK